MKWIEIIEIYLLYLAWAYTNLIIEVNMHMVCWVSFIKIYSFISPFFWTAWKFKLFVAPLKYRL